MGKTRRKKRKPYGTLRKSRRYRRKGGATTHFMAMPTKLGTASAVHVVHGGRRRMRRSRKRRRVKRGGSTTHHKTKNGPTFTHSQPKDIVVGTNIK